MGAGFGRIAGMMAVLLLAACQAPQGAAIGSIAPAELTTPSLQRVSTSMEIGANVETPSGYTAFCRRDPADCAVGEGEAEQIALTPENWTRIQAVNTAMNTAIKPMEDEIHYGRVDYWTIPTDGYGDCEDYALAKRKALADAGFSRRALRLAVAELPSGEPHAVLTITTDRGDFVLDNRNNDILPWAGAKLTWLSRQTADAKDWTGFSAKKPVLLAAR